MEIWKDIKDYEGIYQVSNYGNVKSLERIVIHNKSGKLTIKERFRKPYLNKNGYKYISLSKLGIIKIYTIHSLVATAFLDYIPNRKYSVVDHINNDKLNNNINNLQVVSNRFNTSKGRYNESGLTCVYKVLNKFRARITINGKLVNLGTYYTREEAYNAYLNKKALIIKQGL